MGGAFKNKNYINRINNFNGNSELNGKSTIIL